MVISDLSTHDNDRFLRLVREPYLFGARGEAGEPGSLAAMLVRQLEQVQRLLAVAAPGSASAEQRRAYAAMNQWGGRLAGRAVSAGG